MQRVKDLWLFSFLLITVSACNGPTELNPSEQFRIPANEMKNIENKVRNSDCDAFDKLMDHYEYAASDATWINRKFWLDFAIHKPMQECSAKAAEFYAEELLANSKKIENDKMADKYNVLMEAWRYAEYGYDNGKLEDIKFAQSRINVINLELWKMRKNEFKNAAPR